MTTTIPPEYCGWWRIVSTDTWVNDGLDILGPALLSLTGCDDRLRMHCLLAKVNARATKTRRLVGSYAGVCRHSRRR